MLCFAGTLGISLLVCTMLKFSFPTLTPFFLIIMHIAVFFSYFRNLLADTFVISLNQANKFASNAEKV